MSIVIAVLLGIWIIVALLMMLVILMQRPKSEGLGAAFGGAVTENLFGAQTTNVLVKFTAWLAGIFFVITFLLSVLYAHRSMGGSSLSRELKKTATAAPAAPRAASSAPAGSPASAAANQGSPAGAPATANPPPNPAVGVVPNGSAPPGAAGQSSPAVPPNAAGAQQNPSASPGAPQQPNP
jgi:preprotein translocase subunit SecG